MTRKFTSALAGLILVILVARPEAQQAPAFANGGPAVASRDVEPKLSVGIGEHRA